MTQSAIPHTPRRFIRTVSLRTKKPLHAIQFPVPRHRYENAFFGTVQTTAFALSIAINQCSRSPFRYSTHGDRLNTAPSERESLELPACTLAMDTLFPPPQRFHGAGCSIRILSSSLSNATSRLPFADNRRRNQDILPVTKKLAQLIICSAHQSPCRSTTSRALPCSRSATVKHKMRATLKELTFLTSTVPRPPQRCRTTEIIPF